ncbi:MAG: leucyl aminopeptidase, partial [Lachnospiraceae bacterium]|nr:leucyl aminopeptidase [Lachnospiraceae bacterium]
MTENGMESIVEERFILAAERVRQIARMTEEERKAADGYAPYFQKTASYIEKLLSVWERRAAEKAESGREKPALAQLRARNKALYEDILPEHYDTCYGNPAYTVSRYGEDMGRLLAFLYAELHSQIESVYEGDMDELTIRMELFLEIYQAFVCAGEETGGAPSYEELRQIVYWFVSDYSEIESEKRVRSQLDPQKDFFLRIVMESDLSSPAYLYEYGEYITENEEKLSAYLNSLPQETIRQMADTFTEGYRIGFIAGGKDITKKKTVNIRY